MGWNIFEWGGMTQSGNLLLLVKDCLVQPLLSQPGKGEIDSGWTAFGLKINLGSREDCSKCETFLLFKKKKRFLPKLRSSGSSCLKTSNILLQAEDITYILELLRIHLCFRSKQIFKFWELYFLDQLRKEVITWVKEQYDPENCLILRQLAQYCWHQ